MAVQPRVRKGVSGADNASGQGMKADKGKGKEKDSSVTEMRGTEKVRGTRMPRTGRRKTEETRLWGNCCNYQVWGSSLLW
jgi:hypothetical protein